MKVVFLGTPSFAVPALKAIYNSSHKIMAVISQPDRETDRKNRLLPTEVKKCALQLGLDIFQFENVSKQSFELLQHLKPDVMVTAAYGQLLSQDFLDSAKHGVYNIHASLLPLYRGSSPIQHAILAGDSQSGVTVMKTVLKMDAGDIAAVKRVEITSQTNFLQLHDMLSEAGAELIVEVLDKIENNTLKLIQQDESKATYTKKIVKSDGKLDFALPAVQLVRKINAFNPWPTAFFKYNDDTIKVYTAKECSFDFKNARAGEVVSVFNTLVVACGNNTFLQIDSLQAAGKRQLSAADFLRGYKIDEGAIFS